MTYEIEKLYTPTGLEELFEIMETDPVARIIAGGTDMLVKMRHDKLRVSLAAKTTVRGVRSTRNPKLISIRDIPQLHGIEYENGRLCLGAMSTFTEVAENRIIQESFPILRQAAISMGGPQIRNVATIGGNVCNGATSADSAPTLFALDAELLLMSKKGERVVKIADFYIGPGRVDLGPSEVLIKIRLNPPLGKWGGVYKKFSARKAMDISMLGCAAVVSADRDKKAQDVRIALGTAAPVPLRCPEAESFALGRELTGDMLNELGEKALSSSNPRTSWRATKEFRMSIIKELSARCAEEAYLLAID